MKYHSLSKNGNNYYSFGGEVRYQYFYIKNEDWGVAPEDKDGFVLSRFLLHADFHVNKNFRFFVQLQGSGANGKESGASPVDENPLDLHQAFFDVATKSRKITLRVGRQEFFYGSQRLISVRELPNNRQSFDAVKTILSIQKSNLDLFYGRYVTAKDGVFDDLSNKGITLWGAYLVRKDFAFFRNIDLYYLGLRKSLATFEDGQGRELRHSFGSRIWSNEGNWEYDFEGLYQFGDFSGNQITAWTLSSNAVYKFSNKAHSEIGLKTELISGDALAGDTRLQTFNPLFPKGAYFGLAAFIGPSNLIDVHPSFSMNLIAKKLVWTIDYDVFWRYSSNDGVYAPNASLIFPSGNVQDKFIGHQPATDFYYTPNKYLSFRAMFIWFITGDYMKQVSPGKDIVFLGLTSQLKF